MEIIIAIILIAFIIGYSMLTWGLVIWNFWYWFAMPVFPFLDPITFVQAMGLFLLTVFFKTSGQSIKDQYTDTGKSVGISLMKPWVVLAIGWIFQNIIG